jgi:hypothetical protein
MSLRKSQNRGIDKNFRAEKEVKRGFIRPVELLEVKLPNIIKSKTIVVKHDRQEVKVMHSNKSITVKTHQR